MIQMAGLKRKTNKILTVNVVLVKSVIPQQYKVIMDIGPVPYNVKLNPQFAAGNYYFRLNFLTFQIFGGKIQ